MCWRICLSIVALATAVSAQQSNTIQGRVSDSSHSPIANARIEFHSGTDTRLSTTDDDGTFTIPNVANEGTLLVSYPGFTPVTIGVRRESLGNFLEIYLQPAPIVERILVSPAASDRISAVPNSQFSISKQEIELSGSLTLDDVLREAPGFSLFRRSGSLFANPTSQGVSLRGVGASGASRATVLLDGVPLNTPFGAWVYWDRVPKLSVESVEVVSGAASDLYGSGALGGVVNIITKPLRKSFATVEPRKETKTLLQYLWIRASSKIIGEYLLRCKRSARTVTFLSQEINADLWIQRLEPAIFQGHCAYRGSWARLGASLFERVLSERAG